ncbi:MAG: hypothetical protein IKM26_08555, partial [Clostridia bacterium]|nr:hypothetical protein [Clostridia bacterium]
PARNKIGTGTGHCPAAYFLQFCLTTWDGLCLHTTRSAQGPGTARRRIPFQSIISSLFPFTSYFKRIFL